MTAGPPGASIIPRYRCNLVPAVPLVPTRLHVLHKQLVHYGGVCPASCAADQQRQHVVFLPVPKQQHCCEHDAEPVWSKREFASVGATMSDGKDQHVTVVSAGRLCVLSLLFGAMIASLLPILLNVASLERKADILMMPGGIFASLLAPAAMVPHPMLLLAGNAIFYALCLF